MAQQQPSSVFDKPTDSSHNEMSRQLQDVTDAKEELEEKVKGLEGKLSIAVQEELQLRKVGIYYCLIFVSILNLNFISEDTS